MKAVTCLLLVLLLGGCGDVVVAPPKTGESVLAKACDEMAHSFCRRLWGYGEHEIFTRCRVGKIKECLSE